MQKAPQKIGRYEILRRLGAGGMAEVFLGVLRAAPGFEKRVVVKRIHGHLAEQPKFVEMFMREAAVAAGFNHPNIVQIFDFGVDDGVPFLVMEVVDGLSLSALARRAWARGQALDDAWIVRAIADAALGLHAAHTAKSQDGAPLAIVHRDISPDNLMISRLGATKVVDFGIAKGDGPLAITMTGELKGKIPYMSPEMVQGEPLDGRTDLWALGVCLYWLLLRRRPFEGKSELLTLNAITSDLPTPPRAIVPSISTELEVVILSLLEKDRAARPATGREVHDRLLRAMPAAQAPAQELLDRVFALPPGPDEEVVVDDATRTTRRTDTRIVDLPPRPRAPVRTAVAAGLVAAVALGGVATFAVFSGPDGTTTTAVTPAPVLALVSTTALPVLELAPIAVAAPPPVVEPAPTASAPASPKTIAVDARAPAHVRWTTSTGAPLGRGTTTLRVPGGATSVVAVDGRRSARHVVPVRAGVADLAALPMGQVALWVHPFAQVFLGDELLGETPLPAVSLPVGRYARVRLVGASAVHTTTVDVVAGQTVRVKHDFSGAQ